MATTLLNTLNNPNVFVISDVTFPGSGANKIAHLLPTLNLVEYNDKSYAEILKLDVANMVNFNMFGIPYSSPHVCTYH